MTHGNVDCGSTLYIKHAVHIMSYIHICMHVCIRMYDQGRKTLNAEPNSPNAHPDRMTRLVYKISPNKSTKPAVAGLLPRSCKESSFRLSIPPSLPPKPHSLIYHIILTDPRCDHPPQCKQCNFAFDQTTATATNTAPDSLDTAIDAAFDRFTCVCHLRV